MIQRNHSSLSLPLLKFWWRFLFYLFTDLDEFINQFLRLIVYTIALCLYLFDTFHPDQESDYVSAFSPVAEFQASFCAFEIATLFKSSVRSA